MKLPWFSSYAYQPQVFCMLINKIILYPVNIGYIMLLSNSLIGVADG